MQIAPGVRRIGTGTVINSYIVEENAEITIVDAGLPGFYRFLPRELASIGRTIDDVRALLLTHGHSDHIGFAERLRADRGVEVSIHEADAALARGETPNPAKGLGPVRLAPLAGFLWFTLLRGGARTRRLRRVSTFGDGATLDVPGSPRVILTPGHTPGSAALHFSALGALMVGDAFATYAVTTGERGPRIAPFTADPRRALDSLDRLRSIEAEIVLPGHGDPWTSGVAEAVRRVRLASASMT